MPLQMLLPHLTRFLLRIHHRSDGVWHLDLSARQRSAACLSCQHRSTAVHSSYVRTVADLPMAGTQVLLHLQVRRFFCRQVACPQRIFAERFPTLVSVYGRHSVGVCAALRHVGIAIGGRAGARLAHALGLPWSSRTILRLVHDAPFPPLAAPRVVGLEAWTWRRGRRFGTMACDLERPQVVNLLPDRSAPSVAPGLQAHPSGEIVCRDRSGLYAEGIRHGAPQAGQVIDRSHLVRNVRDAIERFFLRYRRALNTLGASLETILRANPYPCNDQPGASRPMGRPLRAHSVVACPVSGDCRHRAARPSQSPDRLSLSRHAPAARAATVTAPRAAPGRTLHPVSATAMACRLSQRPTRHCA